MVYLHHVAWWCFIASANCVITGSGDWLSFVWCQAIIWTDRDLPSIRPSRTHFNETCLEKFWFKKMHLKELSANWWPFCPSLHVLYSQIARLMRPTWGPPGSCRPQVGPMLAPWTLLSGVNPLITRYFFFSKCKFHFHAVHGLRKYGTSNANIFHKINILWWQ